MSDHTLLLAVLYCLVLDMFLTIFMYLLHWSISTDNEKKPVSKELGTSKGDPTKYEYYNKPMDKELAKEVAIRSKKKRYKGLYYR